MTASANASSIADTAGLSTRVRALAQVKSPRAPFDARSTDFGISCAHDGYFKDEMRGFKTNHLRASSDAVEGNRGHREVSTPSGTAPAVLPPPTSRTREEPTSVGMAQRPATREFSCAPVFWRACATAKKARNRRTKPHRVLRLAMRLRKFSFLCVCLYSATNAPSRRSHATTWGSRDFDLRNMLSLKYR